MKEDGKMERIVYRKTLDVHKNGVQFMLQGFETADNMSRVIEISLMASGDAVDFPLESIMAMMYVTTPNATEPSINECTIKDNKVVYDVLPLVEEGITTMQLKIIETKVDGATSVLASPKFAVEVSKSETGEDGAELKTEFTALEDAVAKAKETYDKRLESVEIDKRCTFRAYYADGTVYETDALRECMLNGNALLSKSYAVGDTEVRDEEATDNSKYYSNVARSSSEEAKYVSSNAIDLLDEARKHGVYTSFVMDFESGELLYASPSYNFNVDEESGELSVEEKGYSVAEELGDGNYEPPGKVNAGRVLIKPRGEWDENTVYNMLDLVTHNGYAFLARMTMVGIEPTDDYPDFWFNLLNINKIVENSIATTVADEVGDILSERFKDMLSEARYVSDVLTDFPEATFVQWDAETESTPYKEGLTERTEGFAIVFGNVADNHTIIAWTMGGDKPENFTHYINEGTDKGWDVLRLDLANNVSGILGIENGGTGANNKEVALLNLGAASAEEVSALREFVKTYQRPWNVDGYVAAISPYQDHIGSYCSSRTTPGKASFLIHMKNSGQIYLNYKVDSGSYAYISQLVVKINNTIHKTYTNPLSGVRQELLDVKKGDVITIEVYVLATIEKTQGYAGISNMYLSANVETPYIYLAY